MKRSQQYVASQVFLEFRAKLAPRPSPPTIDLYSNRCSAALQKRQQPPRLGTPVVFDCLRVHTHVRQSYASFRQGPTAVRLALSRTRRCIATSEVLNIVISPSDASKNVSDFFSKGLNDPLLPILLSAHYAKHIRASSSALHATRCPVDSTHARCHTTAIILRKLPTVQFQCPKQIP